MQTAVQTGTFWFPERKIIDTRINGLINGRDVALWEGSLHQALSEIEDRGEFKIMIDLYGFKPIDMEVHKRFRTIIPQTLSHYGWKVGYIDLFEGLAQTIQYSNIRGVRCTGAAHAHHDETKMGLYERSYSRRDERYFTDPAEARKWLDQLNSSLK